MTLKDKLLIYIYNKTNEIEEENEIMYNQRFSKMDSLDMYELMRRKVYNHAFRTFLNDLLNIILHTNSNDTKRK